MTDSNDQNLGDLSMMELFRLEVESQCSRIAEDLLIIEQNPTSAAVLESLMRASHSIKGAARVVDLYPAVEVAHAMEDVFVAAQNSKIILDQDSIDQLLHGVDMLGTISKIPEGETEKYLAELQDKINYLVQSYSAVANGEKHTSSYLGDSSAGSPVKVSAPRIPEEEDDATEMASFPVDLSSMSMLDLFRIEAENLCFRLSGDIKLLERDPAVPDLLQSLMRACHSMKGAARIIGLQDAVRLAKAMEDVFVASLKGMYVIGPEDMALLRAGVDLLSAIAQAPGTEAGNLPEALSRDITVLVRKLAEIHLQEKPEKPPPSHETSHRIESVIKSQGSLQNKSSDGPEEPSQPPGTEKKPARRADDKDGLRAVRVSAQTMEHMLGLAGESLVESRWLQTFSHELLRLKSRQDDLYEYIDKIREYLQTHNNSELTTSLFKDLQERFELCQNLLIQDMNILEDHARHGANISHRLYKEIITSKMRPFSEGIRGFARMVRDIARELGKNVVYEVTGSDTLVDRDILDRIEAPLNHMLRNALDHGIEPPEERVAKGKAETGNIQLIARHNAGMLSITVKDDGRGIDLDKLRRTIVEKKLAAPEIAADLKEQELLEFLFLPNFSTKKEVSSVSGRGVGLDVVHAVINEVQGKIRSSSKKDIGSSFELQLPLTLSVLRSLITEINGELYGFPLAAIDHVLQITTDEIHRVEGRQYFALYEKRIGIVSAQQVFKSDPPPTAGDEKINVIVLSDRSHIYGLTVDKLLGVRDLVVQRLDPRLGKIKDIKAAAILEDGTPVLIIDVEDVFNSLVQMISGNQIMQVGSEGEQDNRVKRILVADDSITVREVERNMLAARGYEVDVAVDGMDAWNMVRGSSYDLIISDIDMPRMNGFELVSLIKNDRNLQNLPVIIVSYKDREEERKKGLEVGADYYLSKGSFHDQALVDAVLDLIGEAME